MRSTSLPSKPNEEPDGGLRFHYPANRNFVVGRGVEHRSGLRVPTDTYMSRHHFLVAYAKERLPREPREGIRARLEAIGG
ncbi:MAG: hypothetical protein QNJ98_20160 [Planctomycetota bacterium]|nr:hypothetical protein [Planctomycetota bacterium]